MHASWAGREPFGHQSAATPLEQNSMPACGPDSQAVATTHANFLAQLEQLVRAAAGQGAWEQLGGAGCNALGTYLAL